MDVTNIFLHKYKLANVNCKQRTSQEDILHGKSILKYFTQFKNGNRSIVKYKRFICKSNFSYGRYPKQIHYIRTASNTDYFLVVENAETSSLFAVVLKHIVMYAVTLDQKHSCGLGLQK